MLIQLLPRRRPRTAWRRAWRIRIQVHTRHPWTTGPLVHTPSSPIHPSAFTRAIILPMVVAESGPPGSCTESTRTFVTGGGQRRRLGRGWIVPGKHETKKIHGRRGVRNRSGMCSGLCVRHDSNNWNIQRIAHRHPTAITAARRAVKSQAKNAFNPRLVPRLRLLEAPRQKKYAIELLSSDSTSIIDRSRVDVIDSWRVHFWLKATQQKRRTTVNFHRAVRVGMQPVP